MLKIVDLLNRTVREETEIKRSIVVAGIGAVLCITLGSFFCIFYLADVDGYLQDTKYIINLYDFYDKKVGENEKAVFFIGSSVMAHFVYPPEINRFVKKNYSNVTAYNLYLGSDIPIERSLEIQKIIDARPSLVIYGITYRSVTDKLDYGSFFERTKLVYSRLDIRNDSLFLYTAYENNYFREPLSILGKRMYILSAIDYKLNQNTQLINYTFDPFGEPLRMSFKKHTLEEISAEVNDQHNEKWHPVVTNESTRYKDALLYNVKTLQDAGIPVIILNMPLHPLLSEKITDESRVNFYNLLNETGSIWYDLEHDYDGDYFWDSHHATFDGALKFAPRMADLIIEQVEKDVIHYT